MFYNAVLFIYFIIILPKALYEYIFYKKKKKDLLKRLGIKKYNFDSQNKAPIIWIHAVSLGETKAAASLLKKLKEFYPTSYIIISSVTETGHNIAKKCLNLADKFIYFPFDFSFSIKRLFSQVKPNIIIFIETDFWPNFIKEAKKNKSKILLLSAKISKKSLNRFIKFSIFSKNLFSCFDLILAQNAIYKERFSKFISEKKIIISGNLKFTNFPEIYSKDYLKTWRNKTNNQNLKIVTIASTHDKEEEILIEKLKDIHGIKILLAPRHPERFNEVYYKIKKITSCSLFSKIDENDNSKVILIDQMGILNVLYQISDIAIVGGSFIDNIGGHNILEPAFVNTFVLFGPHMHVQKDLKEIVLQYNLGKEVSIDNLQDDIKKILQNGTLKKETFQKSKIMQTKFEKILEDSFNEIKNFL